MFPYEELEVYKKASHVSKKMYRFLKEKKSIPIYAKNQLGRASLSIMLNIAEGSAKFSSRDRKNFFVTARGSVFECSSLIDFLHGEGEMSDVFRGDLHAVLDEISRILYTMIKNLEK
jgi:four helix bundle protein